MKVNNNYSKNNLAIDSNRNQIQFLIQDGKIYDFKIALVWVA